MRWRHRRQVWKGMTCQPGGCGAKRQRRRCKGFALPSILSLLLLMLLLLLLLLLVVLLLLLLLLLVFLIPCRVLLRRRFRLRPMLRRHDVVWSDGFRGKCRRRKRTRVRVNGKGILLRVST